ncbi:MULTISPECIES: PLDc N-terminal domain-containing protein [unclassified Rhodococcus (in: high G+C Gram-positive bacteria)]|jgi:hypothetical protein|uniref:PLDc N-terminal domain-containing protein n=1 Tax=unclassified Rhodococcus (in: high G+C Gram-positive bacteria) TaxID=192944 RepID=UPI00146DABF2|nr:MULTISPECIES: PLDc N-terminal domain-containing protein [unclassified Rhodococcus (in: high G+C Gram-positive bacteria)]MBF0661447.1 hypothetical protein [Rhodococcus sp. (in: high G+C Gram-positive bacteria)]NMD96668.1 hypothetical protein [Rhodococcus sp. BL-253-APC-6A1W]NME79207.1 hypothetical protein [Rhodococcus sp. 105337]
MSRTVTTRTSKKTRFAEMPPWKQALVLTLASVQLSLAATAWADLATRPAEKVNGSKLKWALVIAVNFFGPIRYFRKGRRP